MFSIEYSAFYSVINSMKTEAMSVLFGTDYIPMAYI